MRHRSTIFPPAAGRLPQHRPAEPGAGWRGAVVLIGASTGGPRALSELLRQLPADLGAGVVVAQHMPPGFTVTLAQRLDRVSPLRVCEAEDGALVEPGRVLLAPGGMQTRVQLRDGAVTVRVEHPAPGELYHPSVDLLFASAAEALDGRAVGVVLTGMGDDGANGLWALREAGAFTIAESQSTAVIYGMPRAAAAAARAVLPLHQIGAAIAELLQNRDPRDNR